VFLSSSRSPSLFPPIPPCLLRYLSLSPPLSFSLSLSFSLPPSLSLAHTLSHSHTLTLFHATPFSRLYPAHSNIPTPPLHRPLHPNDVQLTAKAAANQHDAAGIKRKRVRAAMIASVVGNVLEWFDFGVFAFLSPQIGQLFFPSADRYLCLCIRFFQSTALFVNSLSLSLHIHILCIYIHTYIHICIYTYIYTYVYVYTYICIHMCIYIHMYTCLYMYIYMHIYVCVCVCVYVYVNIYIYSSWTRS